MLTLMISATVVFSWCTRPIVMLISVVCVRSRIVILVVMGVKP